MKTMKKIFTLLITVVLVLGMSTVVFAKTIPEGATKDPTKATITITNAANGITYKIAKLFDATVSAAQTNGVSDSIAYTGTIPSTLTNYFEYVNGTDGTNGIKAKAGLDLSDATVQAALKTWAEANVTAQGTSDGSVLEFVNLDFGYYIVTTTQGEAAITVDSTRPNATVVDKNTTPPISDPKKYAGAEEAADAQDTDNDVFIGQTVTYTVEFSTASYDGAGEDAEMITSYIISDDFAGGVLTDIEVTSVTIGGTPYTVGTPAAAPQFDNTGKITIPWVNGSGTVADPYTSKYANGAKIVITYTATVAATATVDGAGNTNRATITYTTDGNNTPQEKPVTDTIYTYAIAIKKIDENNQPLPGAKFQLPFYVNATAAADGAYIYAGTTAGTGLVNELTTPANGLIIVKGVAEGTYSITETAAPKGYNKLGGPVSVTAVKTGQTVTNKTIYLDENGNVVAEGAETVEHTILVSIDNIAATPVVVLNKTGAELPSTGGIGTTIFYIIGAILVIGAGVLLVTRRRMNAQ